MKADPYDTPFHRRFTTMLFVVAFVVLAILLRTANAASNSWDGGGVNGLWTNVINWNGDANVPGGATGFANGDTATFSVNVNTGVTVDATRNVKFITFDTGAGAFTFSGGSFVLTNAGAITMNAGVVNTQTFNTPILLSPTNNSTYSFINNSSTTGANLVIGTVTGQQGNGKTTTLTLSGTNTGSNSVGTISNGTGGGNVELSKTGAGTWILAGSNTYTGSTAVTGGTLLVNGSTVAASAVTVNGSGTTLGGTGTIGGTVTLGNATPGAVINPGPSGTSGTSASVGTLTTGALTLTGANTFHVDAFGTATSAWDQLIVNGTVTLGTTSTLQLSIASGLNFTNGQMYTLINNDLTDAISGTFSNAAQGSTVNFSGYNFMVNYAGGTGNDFVLTAVPEPSTWAAGVLTILAVVYTQRRRIGKLIPIRAS